MESEKKPMNLNRTCWVNEKTPSVVSENSTEDCILSHHFGDLCSVIHKKQAHMA